MKPILLSLFAIWSLFTYRAVADETARPPAVALESLTLALNKGGIENLNNYLESGGKWPRITTDSLAVSEGNARQKELVALSDRLLQLLVDRVRAEPPVDIKPLEAEATLLFSIGEKLWLAGGYRNQVLALLCSKLASYRCGKIVILTKGAMMGPARPAVFTVRDSGEMLRLFIAGIPEMESLSKSGLKEKLEKSPVVGKSWIEMHAAIRGIELDGSTVGERFNKSMALFQMQPFSTISSREDLCSLIFHQGDAQLLHGSDLPALATYLRNNGSLEQLKNENATKFAEVMKDAEYRFSSMPLLRGKVGVSNLAIIVEDIQTPGRIAERLLGANK